MLISKGFLRFYFSVFYLVLISIEKIYQTFGTALNQIFNTLKFVKSTSLRVIFQLYLRRLELWSFEQT